MLIGYGNIARKHLEVFEAIGARIQSSCNRSKIKNDLARTEGGIERTYEDFHEMIKKESPDGILVCVPFWEMNIVLEQIIPYGIPILAEKPTALSLADHLNLIKLAERHNTPVLVGLNRRHYSVLTKAVTMAGGLEKITSVSVEWSENPKHLLNKGLTEKQIRNYIFGNSIHGIDLMCWLGGEIENPIIESCDLGNPFRWLMSLSGKSARGVLCHFHSNWDIPIPWRVSFSSSDFNFVMAPLEQCKVNTPDRSKDFLIEADTVDDQFKTGFYNQAKKFVSKNFSDCDIKSVTASMKLANLLSEKMNG